MTNFYKENPLINFDSIAELQAELVLRERDRDMAQKFLNELADELKKKKLGKNLKSHLLQKQGEVLQKFNQVLVEIDQLNIALQKKGKTE
jgi:hypothetical protein